MAPRPKRKFESDEDTPEQAGLRGTGRGDETSRTTPTAETQSLYDDIRRIEENLNMDMQDRIQLQEGPTVDQAAYLQPPPYSQAPTSPQSPSCASTTHSLTRALDDVAIEEEEPQNKKRKAMRHGPLDGLRRAKAALMRKLGACADCKARKVKCNHFDNTLFEQEYQRRKRRELGIPVAPQPQGAPAQVSQPSFNNLAVDQVGSWQPNLPPSHPSGGNQLEVEIDDLFRGLPSGLTGPQAPYYPAERPLRLITSLPTNLFSPQPMLSNNDITRMPLSPVADHRVPMGRKIGGGVWECKHGDDDNLNPFGVCGQRFSTLDGLRQHFEGMHLPYLDEIGMYKCTKIRFGDDRVERVCGTLCEDDRTSCFQCDGNQWELWRYALVSRTPSLTSGPSVRVGSQDGSAMGGYGQQRYLFQGQGQPTDFEMLFPGRYSDWGDWQQGGSHYSCNEKPAKASSDKCFPVYIPPEDCQYGRKCRSLQSQYTVKGPFLLVISTLSLIVMDNWLVAGLGDKETVSAVLDAMRIHVFWMSLLCVFTGLAVMWLFKHIRFRLEEDIRLTCDQRCFVLDPFGASQHRDIEDTGSMRGEEDAIVLDMLGKSGTLVVR